MENELIEVQTDKKGVQTVSARLLHEKLGIVTRFNDWIKRMIEYGFEENDVLSFDDLFYKTHSLCLKENSISKLMELQNLIEDSYDFYGKYSISLKDVVMMFTVDLMLRKEERTVKGFVYLIKNPLNNSVKIGRTKDLQKRLSAIRNGLPQAELFAFKKVENTTYEEREMHKIFKKKRIEREWFALDEKDIALIITKYGYHEVNPLCVDASEYIGNFIEERKQKRLEQKRA